MFCKNCGTEMSDEAKFCPKCGTPRTGEQPQKTIIEDNEIKFQVKPTFKVGYKILSILWRAIIYVLIIGWAIGLIPVWMEYPVSILITLIIMLMYVAIKLAFEKMQYSDLEYNFYTTKVEYKDGFLNKEEKELKYKYVREVTMSQSILERIFGIGTIRIFTNASSGGYSRGKNNNMEGRNGIYIHCVDDVNQKYKTIKEFIDEGITE